MLVVIVALCIDTNIPFLTAAYLGACFGTDVLLPTGDEPLGSKQVLKH